MPIENADYDYARTVRLLPGESLQKIERIPRFVPTKPPSRILALQQLAQVAAEHEIGSFGPTLASIAFERPSAEDSKELHKYEALFGRDSLRVAIDVLPLYPRLTKTTLVALAQLQGDVYHKGREEEPGRIIHEFRKPNDEIGREITKKYGWQWPYYGSVDATPQFMHALALYARQSDEGKDVFATEFKHISGETRTLKEAYEAALHWVLKRIEDGDGFIVYKSTLPHGIENQVWRDSWDGYSHKDGKIANFREGIASTEVQALAFDSLMEAADLYDGMFHDTHKAAKLRNEAHYLRERILEHFWVNEKGGYFSLGLDKGDDGEWRQIQVRTSNMGHLLNSRLLDGENYHTYVESTTVQLFSEEMLTTTGVRTLASDEARFRPGAYHNGSVWLWDTYFCAEGLRRHGYYGLATYLANMIHSVINVTQMYPEYVRGDDGEVPSINEHVVDVWDEDAGRVNRLEQPPQEIQAWTVAADIARDYYSGRVPHIAEDDAKRAFERSILEIIENPFETAG